MRERADTSGGAQSWNPRVHGLGDGVRAIDWTSAPGDDCVSDSASPLSPAAASPLGAFTPSPVISPRLRRSRSPRVAHDNLDLAGQTQYIFPGAKPAAAPYGCAFATPLDLAFQPRWFSVGVGGNVGIGGVGNVGGIGVGATGATTPIPTLLPDMYQGMCPPWVTRVYGGSVEARLTQEMADFTLYITQDFEDREHLFVSMMAKVVAVTARVLPGARVAAYGSYATGLCIPASDLDVVCGLRDAGLALRPAFRLLAHELRREPWLDMIKPIETATVPVIKLVSRDEELPTDISFDAAETGVPPHRGVSSVEMARRCLAETPKLRPLVLVVKEFLSEKGLNNTYTGGLGSYCLIIMARTYLHAYHSARENMVPVPTNSRSHHHSHQQQSEQPHLMSTEKSLQDMGRAVLGFFRFYGTEFDYATTGISTKRGGTFYRIGDVGYYNGTAPLVIEDPFDPMSNIASGVFSMWRVRAAFASAYHALTADPYTPCASLLQRIIWNDDDM